MNNTASLARDWRYVIGALVVLLVANFGLNYLSSSNDLSKQRAELIESGVPPADIDLPSVTSDTLDRTFGNVYGLVDLINIVALVAFASLIAFYALKVFWPNSLSRIGAQFDDGWGVMSKAERSRWQIGVWALIVFAILMGRSNAASLPVSDKAIDTIIYYEVGGRSYFEKRLTHPTVPAWQSTASGVTVMFGVDVGHMTDNQIWTAMEGIVPDSYIRALCGVNGLKGRSAYYTGLPKVRHLSFTWDQAVKVFERDTLPRFSAMTASAFNLTPERLHPDENGALVSIVFNRGASMSSSSSRREMRSIRYDIGRGYAGYVPGHIRSMKRLWSYSKLRGLHLRRDAEANLFAQGSRLRIAGR